jgi:hypothetical protein
MIKKFHAISFFLSIKITEVCISFQNNLEKYLLSQVAKYTNFIPTNYINKN